MNGPRAGLGRWAVERYDDLARRIVDLPPRLGATRLVAIDGPSGAGKTVFAQRLARACRIELARPAGSAGTSVNQAGPAGTPSGPVGPAGALPGPAGSSGVVVLRTDDLLDGWADQFTFWSRLEQTVLAPLRAARPGRYRRYDWSRGAFTPEPLPVPPAPILILEGVSSARAAVAAELTYAVFVTAPAALRRRRALDRDGSAIAANLDVWRRAERIHFAVDGTAERADLLVDGAPAVEHDPRTQYVRRLP